MAWESIEHIAKIAQIFVPFILFGSFVAVIKQLDNANKSAELTNKIAKIENARALTEQAGNFNSLLIRDENVAEIWYDYGKKWIEEIESKGNIESIKALRYRELLCQRLVFHEYIFFQNKNDLLDSEIYKAWNLELIRIVKNHNLDVFGTDFYDYFPGDFGEHLKILRTPQTKV